MMKTGKMKVILLLLPNKPGSDQFHEQAWQGIDLRALLEERCDELSLELMVNNNTAFHETAFTVSVDFLDMDVQQVFRPRTGHRRLRH